MKYRKTLLTIIGILAIGISTLGITGCAATSPQESFNMLQQTDQIELEYAVPDYDYDIEESTVELLPWLALGSLESHPELRQAFDEYFGITGTVGNKEGSLYYNTDTEKADQNVTLFMVLKNADMKYAFTAVDSLETLSNIAAEHYADVEADDLSAPYATINAYFELLPDQEAGQFDGDSTISRAQSMALLMRATTVANEAGAPEVNKDFTSAVGESQYTDFAAAMDAYSYINTNNGLTENVFNSTMTKGEYICMVTNLLMDEYQSVLKENNCNDIFADTEVSITTVTDGGDISLNDAMKDVSQGVPNDMYKTFETAVKYGFITEDALKEWDSSITKSEAVELFVTMTSCYSVKTAQGLYGNGYQSPEELSEKEAISEENKSLTRFAETLPGEGTLEQNYQAWARSQGADYALGWTFVYLNGSGAGDQPTYGVYMKEGSRYGEIFHVGDIIPNGSRLDGTREEEDAISTQKAKEKVEEAGGSVYTDPETGKTIWDIP